MGSLITEKFSSSGAYVVRSGCHLEFERQSEEIHRAAHLLKHFDIVVADIFGGCENPSSNRHQEWLSVQKSISDNITFLWHFLHLVRQFICSPGGMICLFPSRRNWNTDAFHASEIGTFHFAQVMTRTIACELKDKDIRVNLVVSGDWSQASPNRPKDEAGNTSLMMSRISSDTQITSCVYQTATISTGIQSGETVYPDTL